MTIIINRPSTDVTELTSETLQAEGYEIDMDECWKIYNMLGIQIFPSELYSISAFKPYFKDKIFFDIGASVGSWSAFALMYEAKEVYAFDPLPDDRVSPTDNYNRLVTKVNNTATTLDWFSNYLTVVPDIIKIDVEGDEVEVLKGAKETLKSKPLLMIEAHNKDLIRQVIDLIGEPAKVVKHNLINDATYHMFYLYDN
jgi:precorrin-6B methylase 2